MAGNTRGKIKEHYDGIHRNFDWILYHCEKILGLIQDKNPGMSEATKSLADGVKTLDELTQGIYSKV